MESDFGKEIENFKCCVILVEGKKDVAALEALGFEKVFAVHAIGTSVRERIEEIVSEVGREKVYCVLTDLDNAGRKFYAQSRTVLAELGVRIDGRLRKLMVKEGISHVEGLFSFLTGRSGINISV